MNLRMLRHDQYKYITNVSGFRLVFLLIFTLWYRYQPSSTNDIVLGRYMLIGSIASKWNNDQRRPDTKGEHTNAYLYLSNTIQLIRLSTELLLRALADLNTFTDFGGVGQQSFIFRARDFTGPGLIERESSLKSIVSLFVRFNCFKQGTDFYYISGRQRLFK